MKKEKVLIICGETASGKTKLSIEIAKENNGEIINCDVYQYYSEFEIGTGRPTKLEMEDIPHHLFGVLNSPLMMTSKKYIDLIEEKCEEILKRKKLPIIVGGSHFYIYSLFFKIKEDKNKEDKNKKEENLINRDIEIKKRIYTDEEKEKLWKDLLILNSEVASKIHKNDVFRVERAIEKIKENGGIEKLEYSPKYEYEIILKKNENSYNIENRVRKMINEGWFKEAKDLKEEWKNFAILKKIIGYEILIKASDNILELEEEKILKIIQLTKDYARKQRKFIRKLKRELEGEIKWREI